jgi:hypothetical protein
MSVIMISMFAEKNKNACKNKYLLEIEPMLICLSSNSRIGSK